MKCGWQLYEKMLVFGHKTRPIYAIMIYIKSLHVGLIYVQFIDETGAPLARLAAFNALPHYQLSIFYILKNEPDISVI